MEIKYGEWFVGTRTLAENLVPLLFIYARLFLLILSKNLNAKTIKQPITIIEIIGMPTNRNTSVIDVVPPVNPNNVILFLFSCFLLYFWLL